MRQKTSCSGHGAAKGWGEEQNRCFVVADEGRLCVDLDQNGDGLSGGRGPATDAMADLLGDLHGRHRTSVVARDRGTQIVHVELHVHENRVWRSV